MAYNLRIEPSRKEDLPRIAELIVPTFQKFAFNRLTGETDTPEGRAAAEERHLRTWKEHEQQMGNQIPFAIKCVHTDLKTGEETMISTAECGIYHRERSEIEYRMPPYFLTADWVDDEEKRRAAKDDLKDMLNARIKWFAGKPYGVLMWMVTDPKYQRLGAATKCVQWFIDRCMELGIPAYLEASDQGAPVYQRLGFEIVDHIEGGGYTLPVLIRWPENYPEKDRKPVLGWDWKV